MVSWFQQFAEWLRTLRWWFTVRPWERAIIIRCGRWVFTCAPGIHLRLPFVDEAIIQNVRTRVLNLPVQTVTHRSGQTVTMSAIVRWRIADVRKMYETIHNPEDWIYNVVLAALATAVCDADLHMSLAGLGDVAMKALTSANDVGIVIEGVAVTDIARVRTYRLITGEGNSGWSWSRVGSLEGPRTV